MKTMTVGDLKTNFSEALKEVQNGEKIAVTFGKKKEIVAYLVSKTTSNKKRRLGILEGKGQVVFTDNFKMTEDELLNL